MRAYTQFMSPPCHCTRLRIATRKMTALYDTALAPTGINVAQFSILRTIERRQPVSLTELGRLLALDRSTMGRNVRVLEKQGLVALGRGKDQREAAASLTETGTATLRAAEPLWEDCQTDMGRRLGAERLALLAELNQLL